MYADAFILIDAYKRLAAEQRKNLKDVPSETDKRQISGLASKAFRVRQFFLEQVSGNTAEIMANLRSAKGVFIQFNVIKQRHPELIAEGANLLVEEMIKITCKCEAEMIADIKQREMDGSLIDLQQIFSEKKYYRQLGTVLAGDIVLKAILEGSGFNPNFADGGESAIPDKSTITVFIDESIHNMGAFGAIGNFSYIICRGFLKNERLIKPEVTIATGVEYVSERVSTDRITETAIGKVLIKLKYDFDFCGSVYIRVDNQGGYLRWKNSSLNKRLSREFAMVDVAVIPRFLNTKADALCRERLALELPTKEYYTIINRCTKYEKRRKSIRIKSVWNLKKTIAKLYNYEFIAHREKE